MAKLQHSLPIILILDLLFTDGIWPLLIKPLLLWGQCHSPISTFRHRKCALPAIEKVPCYRHDGLP